jgi:hypothetical protein
MSAITKTFLKIGGTFGSLLLALFSFTKSQIQKKKARAKSIRNTYTLPETKGK